MPQLPIAPNGSDLMSLDHSAEEAHCRRTAALAVELGRRAGIPAEPLAEAALLHHSLEPLRHSSGLGRLAWQVVAGEDTRRIAGIVQVCNLFDEQIEALEFEYKDVDTILDEIQSFAVFEGFDPALVEHLRELRCREFPTELELPVEGAMACRVFRTLSAEREYEIRELESLALRDPVLAGSLLEVANSALFGRAQRVSTVGRAIASVGVLAARKVMLAAAMRPLFASAGLGRIWSHSLSSAPLCSALAGHTGLLTPEEGLLFGLVHDIGAVAVQFLPRQALETHRNLVEGGCPPPTSNACYLDAITVRSAPDCSPDGISRTNSSTPCASIISRNGPHRNSRPWPIWRSSGPGWMRTSLPSAASKHVSRASA